VILDKIGQAFVAHLVGSAFARLHVFVLGRLGQEFDELFLDLAGSGDVDLVYVRHFARDFLEKLLP
jgi:hypothetical protein